MKNQLLNKKSRGKLQSSSTLFLQQHQHPWPEDWILKLQPLNPLLRHRLNLTEPYQPKPAAPSNSFGPLALVGCRASPLTW
jgi:hypothetical protein